jgi:sporulation protein YlmC with PRC-barrel domain
MTEDSASMAGIDAGGDPDLVEVSNLVGSAVQNHRGEYLGKIKEVMVDVHIGQVNYVVLSFSDGFLSMDKKFFAVPWDALTFDSEHGSVVLTVEKDRLKYTPGFDKDSWPGAIDGSFWWQKMQSHY